MKFYDRNDYAKVEILWPSVELSFTVDRQNTARHEWCESHESCGRYYKKWSHYTNDRGRQSISAMWYFELDADAVMFALKFK